MGFLRDSGRHMHRIGTNPIQMQRQTLKPQAMPRTLHVASIYESVGPIKSLQKERSWSAPA
jgi:hypothetical protein